MLNIDDRLIKEVAPKIKPNALAVLLSIAIHSNQKTNRSFPSHERLMTLTGLGRDAVYSALETLKKEGLLQVVQSIDSKKKTFGRRSFKISTRFIQIFVAIEDAEPLPENPYTGDPHTGEPYTANPETYQIKYREQISNKKEQINSTNNSAHEKNDFYSQKEIEAAKAELDDLINQKKETAPPVAAAPPAD